MYRFFGVVLVLACGVCGAVGRAADGTGPPDASEAVRLALYAYDRDLRLNATVATGPALKGESARQVELRTRYLVSFDSVHDQRVPAILTIPRKSKAPFPAVILLAGSGGDKDTDYVRLSSDMMSTLGYATLSIDAQYHGDRKRPGRSGDIHMLNSYTMRDAWMQTVVDLRRAVDFLNGRTDIDHARIGYLGFSQGGMLGATFIGVEPRVAVACLAIPGGGFLDWARSTGRLTPDTAGPLAVNASLTDPIYFVGRFGGRPLLVLSALHDELIPKAATEALFEACREPKTLQWYSSGHVLPPNALLVDARAFFAKYLGRQAQP